VSFKDVDLLDLNLHLTDPEAMYEWMREDEPLFWDAVNEMWAVSRYEDVVFVSKNTDVFCSRFGAVPKISLDIWPDAAMINLDGKEHTRQRNLVAKGFAPNRIRKIEEKVTGICDRLIDTMLTKDEPDLVKDFARPLPMRIIGEMLGYPPEKDAEILDWTDIYVNGGSGPQYIDDDVVDAFGMFMEHHEEIMEQRLEKRGDDLISVWLDAEIDGHKLDEETLLYEHSLLLVGGSETTRNSLSGGVEALLQHPEQWQALRDNPDLITNAIEEILRWTTPFIRMRRTLTCDYEMHGKTMSEGDEIVMLYPAANRDPRVYENPQVFDIRRTFDKPSLSFGYGKHYCLGAPLARLELKVGLERLLAKAPDIKLRGTGYKHPSSFIRGLKTLPISIN
jgi:cytochrome P450 family 142 subfamily A polypeptide 1